MMYVREREEIEYDCNVWTCILQILMYTSRKGSIANSLHLPGSYRTFFIDILLGGILDILRAVLDIFYGGFC